MSEAHLIKSFKTYADQVCILKDRGMIIDDSQKAETILSTINYYRLSGYWYPFMDKKHSYFNQKISFQDILDLYNYDMQLRMYLFNQLSKIEIAFRTLIGHELGEYDEQIHLKPNSLGTCALNKKYYSQWIKRYNKSLSDSKEQFVKHHKEHYGGILPIWAAVEIMDWGMLSHLYQMSPNDAQIAMSEKCGLTTAQLGSWLKSLNVVRNLSAHHARMYNRVYDIKPKLPQNKKWQPIENNKKHIFGFMTMIEVLISDFNLEHDETLESILQNFPQDEAIRNRVMGVPSNWKSILNDIISS